MAVNKMNKIIALLLIVVFFLSGCSTNYGSSSETCNEITCNAVVDTAGAEREINIEKLEIYHFHGTNQCYSCKTVGAYAEETVNTYFADELKSGKIVFGHINAQLPENEGIVKKYGATGSSLWFGTYNSNEFKAEQNTNVWYKIKDKQDYMNYLKGVIEQKLAEN